MNQDLLRKNEVRMMYHVIQFVIDHDEVNLHAPYDDDWSSRTIRAAFDLSAWSDNQVEASNLDQLAMQTVEDNLAAVSGQTTLYARRIAGIRSPEIDEKGDRIYRVGGTIEVWTYQPLS